MSNDYLKKKNKYYKKILNLIQKGGGIPFGRPPKSPSELIEFWNSPKYADQRLVFKTYIEEEIKLDQKEKHYLWWVYPNIRELSIGSFSTELNTIDEYETLFKSQDYIEVRTMIDSKPLVWFPKIDHGRVINMRKSTQSIVPLKKIETLEEQFQGLSFQDSAAGPSDASGPRFPSIDVTPNGNCFFYSLYQALEYHNLLDDFLSYFRLPRIDENRFNIEMRQILGRLFYSNENFELFYQAYISSNRDPGTYEIYSQTGENIPEEKRIFPILGRIKLNKDQFKDFVNRRINTNTIFPIGALISQIKNLFETIFSDQGYKLNFTPNRIEFTRGVKNTSHSPDEIQFKRASDYDRNTVYLHNISSSSHYHWIKTDRIIGSGRAENIEQDRLRRQRQEQDRLRRQRQEQTNLSSSNPYGVQPTSNPYVQLHSNPYGVQPTSNPYGVQIHSNPNGVQPTLNPYGVQPTSNPYVQLHSNLYGVQRPPNPYGVQPTSNPYGVQRPPNPYGVQRPPNPYGTQPSSNFGDYSKYRF
jgi:hypothetical protein